MITNLNTIDDVIDVLGGKAEVATLVNTRVTAVYNWIANGQFPADTYLLIQDELKTRGVIAPNYLWPMRQPVRPKKIRVRNQSNS